ncbi:hypothetical protein FIU87_20625 [Bacillus sp. THAF10]|uniref:DUF1761 family protein n=1 Tax=Bacillus sp. THAF10 TaxID=2587848 RepID=UPI0012687D17|nr:DUF1761 family protein [Bacillus sp. THAF10]QFT91059.1 hypothetical protein FIU87_20625 [Bacillus sp. THAF10]
MEIIDLNLIAILAGAVLYAVYGGIYYSVVLGKKKEFIQSEGPIKYMVAVLVAILSSGIMNVLIGASGAIGLGEGLFLGLLVGLVITLVYLKNMLFGLMSKKAFLIAIGDHLVIFTLLGGLHGLLN